MRIFGFIDQKKTGIRAEIDGEICFVPNDMSNRHRQVIAEWEAQGNEIPDYVSPPPPQRIFYVERLWQRASDDEAARIETATNTLPLRQRKIFAAAITLTEGEDLLVEVTAKLVAEFGEQRASELLAFD